MTLSPNDPRWAYALTNLAAFLWGTNFVLGRLLRADIGPATLTLARFAVAGLVFAWLLRRAPPSERWPGAQWPGLLAMKIPAGEFKEGDAIKVERGGANLQICATEIPMVEGDVMA